MFYRDNDAIGDTDYIIFEANHNKIYHQFTINQINQTRTNIATETSRNYLPFMG